MLTEKMVLAKFVARGLLQSAFLSRDELDTHLQALAEAPFSSLLAHKNSAREVRLDNYCQVVAEIYLRIKRKLEQDIHSTLKTERQVQRLKEELRQTSPSQPSRRQELNDRLVEQVDRLATLQQNISILQTHKSLIRKTFQQPSEEEEEDQQEPIECGLQTLLALTLLCLSFELVMSLGKTQFTSLLQLVSVLAIFGLDYYDRSYIVLCIVLTMIAEVSDAAWLIFHWSRWMDPTGPSDLTSSSSAFYRFCVIATVLVMTARLAVGIILYRNRNIQFSHHEFNLLGWKVQLMPTINPVTHSLATPPDPMRPTTE